MTYAGAHWFFLGFNPADGSIFAGRNLALIRTVQRPQLYTSFVTLTLRENVKSAVVLLVYEVKIGTIIDH